MRIITSNSTELLDDERQINITIEFNEESEMKYDLIDAGVIAIIEGNHISSIKLTDLNGIEKAVQLTNDEVKQIEYYLEKTYLI